MNRGQKSENEQGYTVYGISQVHKSTLSRIEKRPLNYTAIYYETVTFPYILLRKYPILNGALKNRCFLLRGLNSEDEQGYTVTE